MKIMTNASNVWAVAAALALPFAIGCGGAQKDGDGPKVVKLEDQPEVTYEDAEGTGEEGPALPKHLEFAEMTVYEGDQPVLRIHADGKTELASKVAPGTTETGGDEWTPGPVVAADGTIMVNQQPVARANPDGSMVDLRTNETLPVTYTAEKVVTEADGVEQGLALAEDGSITLVGPQVPEGAVMKVEGATSEVHRKAVLALLGALFLSGKK